jgi:ABC-type dipeptide/oligopeptide/nickel transport system permease component
VVVQYTYWLWAVLLGDMGHPSCIIRVAQEVLRRVPIISTWSAGFFLVCHRVRGIICAVRRGAGVIYHHHFNQYRIPCHLLLGIR